MAIYHLHVGIISRSTGRSSVAAAAYRSGEKIKNEHDGITHDYSGRNAVQSAAYRAGEKLDGHDFTNKKGVVYSEIMLPENAPEKFQNRAALWNAVEQAEKRKDAQTARDIDVALPVEFERREQIELLQEYIQKNFVDNGMIADFSIHDKQDGNPHAHILLTTRNVDEDGFKGKNRSWNKLENLKQWREDWAKTVNREFERLGVAERIDHRTLEAQGIDRVPTVHVGIGKHISNSDRAKTNDRIIAKNEAKNLEFSAEYMRELKDGYLILDKEIFEIQQENSEARRDMNILRREAEETAENAEHIHNMQTKIDELKSQRNLRNRNTLDAQIQRLEISHEQARNYFQHTYKIPPEQADMKVKELENKAKSKEHLQERLKDKLTPLIEERNSFKSEYQRRKLISGTKTDEPKNNSERALEMITEKNFQEILRTVDEKQAKVLVEMREREREREKEREIVKTISRSYY